MRYREILCLLGSRYEVGIYYLRYGHVQEFRA